MKLEQGITKAGLSLVCPTRPPKPSPQFPVLQGPETKGRGEVLSDTFEEGDQVEEGQLLYTLDSSNASSSQTQAQNSYSQAQSNYQQAVNAKYPSADMGGTVSEVYVKNGESVSAGTELVRIVGDNNIYMTFLFPYASPSDFYVGQTATIYIGNFDGTTSAVSSATAIP